ncbi:MAG: hypothetical protein QW286_03190 [Candidatus Aenigmatarchaeota archaeon]
MSLKEEVRKIFQELFGPELAKEVDKFDDPELYPNDFLEECEYFLEKLIGKEAARKRTGPLYKKYIKGGKQQGKPQQKKTL